MESTNSERTDAPTFRRCWWGYDRAQVEEFLRQTALDRQRHQESLAWLDALMSGYDPQARDAAIAAKRRESHEARIAALRRNAGALAKADPGPSRLDSIVPIVMAAWESVRSISRPHVHALLLGGALISVALLAMRGSSSTPSEVQATPAPAATQKTAIRAATDNTAQLNVASGAPAAIPDHSPSAETPAPAVEQISIATSSPVVSPSPVAHADGLVLTLTALRTCWVGTTVDGGQRLERILKPDETVMVHAHEEVVLRVGDAAAISVLINNQPMKPLGASGQVASRRISRANYLTLLGA